MKKAFHVVFVTIAVWLPLLFISNVANAYPLPVNNFLEEYKKQTAKEWLYKEYKDGSRAEFNYWELPGILSDVSDIKYLGNNRFACIQDKVGSIFIYNTNANKIEKEIPFSGPGDFEGIAIAGKDAYAVQSNGKIYEIVDYLGVKPLIHEYTTPLTAKHNVEGLTYDKNNNQLLLAIKGADTHTSPYKGVYAFDLKSKRLAASPIIKINLNDPFFGYIKSNNKSNVFQPSAIEIHPITNDIYILQGSNPKLLVMDTKGRIKKLYTFNFSMFPQAEGLAFTPKGELYISNEGKDGVATIVKVTL